MHNPIKKIVFGRLMLRLDNKSLPRRFKMFIWYLMSFQAGYINVGGFIIFGSFVSHVTGTSSQIGMGIAGLDAEKIMTFVTILGSFILGAGFAGKHIGQNILSGKKPAYIFVTSVKALIFLLVLILSEIYFYETTMTVKLILIHLLSFVCGIQNATCSQATNGFLKPTHMTGLSTDIGINLFKYNALDENNEERKLQEKNNRIRFRILGSFISGGAIAFFIFSTNGHHGFLFPFLSSIAMLYTTIVSERIEGASTTLTRKLKINFRFAQLSLVGVLFSVLATGLYEILNG